MSGELLLKDIIDLNTLKNATHTYNSAGVHLLAQANGRTRIRLESSDTPSPFEVSRASQLESDLVAERSRRARLEAELDSETARRAQLEREVVAERNEVTALRRSRAYRLGEALLRPARKVRSLLRH